MASENESFLIVGAGLFGASTALRLIHEKPWATITLVDRTPFPNPSSASHDFNKVVRADYANRFYMELALEAREEWRNHSRYRPYYQQPGIAFADENTGNAAIANYKALGCLDVQAEMISLQDARDWWGGVFKSANWDGVQEIFWNPGSGWAEAAGALKDTIRDAVAQGVRYHEATVTTLVIDTNGACTGVRTKDGELRADRIVLCTGAFTAKLLADTAPTNKNLQVSGRLVAAGAVSCTARVAPELSSQFKNSPVFVNGLGHTRGECVPLNRDGQLKLNCENSFTRMEYHEASQQYISVPPQLEIYNTWGPGPNVPKGLRNEIDNIVRNMFGHIAGVQVESYRLCWDAITPNQDFIISPHPYCRNLYIAAGGSFHGWKFLPTIGKYVVMMLDGTLKKEIADLWAWDRKHNGTACKTYIPKRDLSEIDGYSALIGI